MAKKVKQPLVEKPQVETIQNSSLEDIMGDRYATYAKYVIQDRAIPDVRDGLKPVQRRIIYAMYHSGNTSSKPYRKSATSVGEVMGKYHPHGDLSIYEALAHMSQNWKYRVPLIDFQGNNGSIDGDNPAAHRYTEARLAEVSEELTRDIEKNTVDMQLTFDDSQLEPTVLPARFPNLYVNGTQGIAVAMATNIPPHNLGEIIEAAIYRLTHPKSTLDDLYPIVKGPDFPTGGSIYRTESLKSIYETGHGRVEIVSRTEFKTQENIQQIIVREIPYGVIKSSLVKEIDEIRYSKIIDGIVEVRDESDHKGLRIAIDLKKEANAEKILNYLLSKTDLKSSFSANMVAIVNGHPTTLNLLTYLDAYLAHQVDVITRLSTFDLQKAESRLEIVSGLIKAISMLDDVVKAIRKSKDRQNAIDNLMSAFKFSKPQADAIVNLQLYKLTNTDITTLKKEKESLEAQIDTLKGILNDRKKLDKSLIQELKRIAETYGTPRMTSIKASPKEALVVDTRELIAKEDVMIAISRDGYVKRSPIKSFRSSEGAWPGLKENDWLVGMGQATTMDFALAFTNLGNFLYIPIHELVEGKWKDEGRHINERINLPPEEKILKVLTVGEFKADAAVIIVTKMGQIKRTQLTEFQASRYSKPLQCIRLMEHDQVADVALTYGKSNLLIATEEGYATLFNENELSPIGIKAGGVKAIAQLKGEDCIAQMVSLDPDERTKILMVTDAGQWRIFDSHYINKTARLGKIQFVFRSFKTEPHRLVFWKKLIKSDEPQKLTVVLSSQATLDVKIDDYAPTPVEKYAKQNIKLARGVTIVSAFNDAVQRIDSASKTYATVQSPEGKMEQSKTKNKFKQVDLFESSKK